MSRVPTASLHLVAMTLARHFAVTFAAHVMLRTGRGHTWPGRGSPNACSGLGGPSVSLVAARRTEIGQLMTPWCRIETGAAGCIASITASTLCGKNRVHSRLRCPSGGGKSAAVGSISVDGGNPWKVATVSTRRSGLNFFGGGNPWARAMKIIEAFMQRKGEGSL